MEKCATCFFASDESYCGCHAIAQSSTSTMTVSNLNTNFHAVSETFCQAALKTSQEPINNLTNVVSHSCDGVYLQNSTFLSDLQHCSTPDTLARDEGFVDKFVKKEPNKIKKFNSTIDIESQRQAESSSNSTACITTWYYSGHSGLSYNDIPVTLSTSVANSPQLRTATYDSSASQIWQNLSEKGVSTCISNPQSTAFSKNCKDKLYCHTRASKNQSQISSDSSGTCDNRLLLTKELQQVVSAERNNKEIGSPKPKSSFESDPSHADANRNFREVYDNDLSQSKLQGRPKEFLNVVSDEEFHSNAECIESSTVANAIKNDRQEQNHQTKLTNHITSNLDFHQKAESDKNKQLNKRLFFSKKRLSDYSEKYKTHKQVLDLQKHRLCHRSTADLLNSGSSRRRALITEDQRPSSGIRKNVLCISQAQIKQTQLNADRNIITSASNIPERARLCKSLNNLTADDLLSVPCSSIFHHQDNSSSFKSNISSSPHTVQLIPSKGILKIVSKAEPNNVMPKHIKETNGRKYKINGKIVATTDHGHDIVKVEKAEKKEPENQISTDSEIASVFHQEGNDKPARKTPKLTKSLFPFMRKSRKRQNTSSTGHVKPLKAQELKDVRTKHPKQSNHDKQLSCDVDLNAGTNTIKKVEENSICALPNMESVGFQKLKIPSQQAQRNVHADYATRVARVRRSSSKEPKETSPKSTPGCGRSDSRGRSGYSATQQAVVFRDKPRPRRVHSRHSADFGTSTESIHSQNRCRPSSLAAPGPGIFLHPHISGSRSASDISTCGDALKDSNSAPARNSIASYDKTSSQNNAQLIHASVGDVIIYQNEASKSLVYKNPSQIENRSSTNLDFLQSSRFPDQSSYVNQALSTDMQLTGSITTSSLAGISTPDSSIVTGDFLSVATGNSLLSSNESLFGEELYKEQTKVKVQWAEITKNTPIDLTDNTKKDTRHPLVRRSKSLCRAEMSTKVNTTQMNRRSVSPSFNDRMCKTAVSRTNTVQHQAQPILINRNHSMKDLTYRRPSKPTTPKPQKMSCSSSSSSLNMFNFRLSSQNLLPTNDTSNSGQNSFPSNEVLFDAADVRGRSSAKNAQIRRRLSLQVCKPCPSDVTDETLQNEQEFKAWKRHSIAGIDTERVKKAMAQWSGNLPMGNGSLKRMKRKIRPLSEVSNTRWEVHAIPEHKEVLNVPTNHSPRSSPYPVTEDAQRKRASSTVQINNKTHPLSVAAAHNGVPRLLHCDVNEIFHVGILGTCFSEEDISVITNEEFTGIQRQARSLSVIGGLNTMPHSVMRFYPPKYDMDSWKRTSFNGHAVRSSSLCEHELQERSRGQAGSTVSGNERSTISLYKSGLGLKKSD